MAGAIGHHFGAVTDDIGRELARASAHGISGGVISELQGGKFGAAFAANFFSSVAGSFGSDLKGFNVVKAAVVGDTASKLGGGKFESGAVSAAFTHLFNKGLNEANNKMLTRTVEQGFAIVPVGATADWSERKDTFIKLMSEVISGTSGMLSIASTPVSGGLEEILGFGLGEILPGVDIGKTFNYAGDVLKNALLTTRPVDVYSVVRYQEQESFLLFFKRWGEVQTNTQLIVNTSTGFRGWAGSNISQLGNNSTFLSSYEKTLKSQIAEIFGGSK